jgi:hypothetical protein
MSDETTTEETIKESRWKKYAPAALGTGFVTLMLAPGALYVAGSIIQYKTAQVNLEIAQLKELAEEATS